MDLLTKGWPTPVRDFFAAVLKLDTSNDQIFHLGLASVFNPDDYNIQKKDRLHEQSETCLGTKPSHHFQGFAMDQ